MKISEMSVQMIDHMGSDLSVVNAARVSFGKQVTELQNKDVKLINYLAEHNHWTPFAHCFASFRIKAPIFVARQLVKHQVGLAWNEVSRRYVDDEPEFWFPKEWRSRPTGSMKQGSGEDTIDLIEIDVGGGYRTAVSDFIIGQTRNQLFVYKQLIENEVAPEQARMVLPQNTMTEWIWSGSLAAFARVCKLRLDDHAQLETQEIAAKIAGACTEIWPVSFNALMAN